MQVKYTNFPIIVESHSALDLYELTYPTHPQRNEAYFSFPITSGGTRRMINLFNKELTFSEKLSTAIRYNVWFAQAVCRELEAITEDTITFTIPYLGKRKGWYEFDYNLFWFYYISGIPYKRAQKFDNQIKHDSTIHKEVFNNLHATFQERKIEYKKMIGSFMNFVEDIKKELKPMVKMFLMPDHHISLGNSMEKTLASYLGVPIYEILFNRSSLNFNKSIANNTVWATISEIDKSFKIPYIENPNSPHLIILKLYK